MHERGRLQSMVRPLIAEKPGSKLAELSIDQGYKLVARLRIASRPLAQETCHFVRVSHG